jgi:glycosyltransferase involved in cell wall biosynthesis
MCPDRIRTILYVHSSDEMYGADLILLELIDQLDRQRFRPIVVVPTDIPGQGLLSQALHQRQIKTIKMNTAVLRRKYFSAIGFLIYCWRVAVSVVSLVRLIRHESVDLVHSNTSAVIAGALAARLTGRPHLWHIHEIIVQPRLLWRLLAWLLPRLSDRVVAVSGPTYEHLCLGSRYNERKAIVIHNGIDITRFDRSQGTGNSLREEWGIKAGQPVVGTIGRISYWKGQDYFLKVAVLVAQSHPETRFALVGGAAPGQEQVVEKVRSAVAQFQPSSAIILQDFRSDVPAILDAYDIFVLPSTLPDPFPTVILEAMAAGKPVIANAHGGSIEMVEHQVTGLLVPPGQPQEMAKAITDLLDAPEKRRAMGQQGRKRLESCFSLESFSAKWIELYDSLIASV